MAITLNLFVDQGTNWTYDIQIIDNNVPMDLTNYVVRSSMRRTYNSPNSTDIAASITTASEGRIQLALEPEDTDPLRPGRYVYDVEVESNNGVNGTITRVVNGILTLNPQVTQEYYGTKAKNLEELPNVIEPDGMVDGALLVYDLAQEKWVVTANLDLGTY